MPIARGKIVKLKPKKLDEFQPFATRTEAQQIIERDVSTGDIFTTQAYTNCYVLERNKGPESGSVEESELITAFSRKQLITGLCITMHSRGGAGRGVGRIKIFIGSTVLIYQLTCAVNFDHAAAGGKDAKTTAQVPLNLVVDDQHEAYGEMERIVVVGEITFEFTINSVNL